MVEPPSEPGVTDNESDLSPPVTAVSVGLAGAATVEANARTGLTPE